MLAAPLLTAFTQGWAMGWASAPYDPLWADRYPRRAAWMAAAGPAGNFCIALVALLLLRVGLLSGYFVSPSRANFSHVVAPGVPGEFSGFAAQGLSVFLMLNVLLGCFNLLPLPPLDGSAVLGLLLPEGPARTVRRLAGSSQFSLMGLLAAWLVFPRLASPLFRMVLLLVHPGISFR
jgi:Zn-dependent protease